MPARRVPASTATTELLDQLVEVDRTKSPVTASSFGPPVGPYDKLVPKSVIHIELRE
jgi:hypothetical protein